jgi:hypothetical protein
MSSFKPVVICKGKPHRRVETVERIPTDKPLLIKEIGTCKRCKTQRQYERFVDTGSFVGSLESNPIISHYSGYDR